MTPTCGPCRWSPQAQARHAHLEPALLGGLPGCRRAPHRMQGSLAPRRHRVEEERGALPSGKCDWLKIQCAQVERGEEYVARQGLGALARSLSGCPIRPGATRRAPRGTGFGIAIFQAGAKRHFEVTHDKPIGTSQSHAMEKRHGRLALARLRLLSQVLSYLMFRASRTTA